MTTDAAAVRAAGTPDGDLFLFPNGTIHVRIGEEARLLRRPTLGEFRDFREAMFTASDQAQGIAEALNTDIEALVATYRAELIPPADLDDEAAEAWRDAQQIPREVTQQIRAIDRESSERVGNVYGELMLGIIERLSGRKVTGGAESLPAWAGDADTIATMMRHFRSVPAGRG